ncbi:gamma-glutamyltransferase [Ammoniphilus sp. YIM 78166]|uniref:gamma-glutamyltransferase n=1 Tax=Ammoniphilus sp. YIM 78166 TaxID=1644106 RepID=UPI00106F328D|nr:gamma-glutamyltransferase [Ammoniphilus sp. YIM 78166]
MVKSKWRKMISVNLALSMLFSLPVAGLASPSTSPWYEQHATATGTGGAAATEHPEASRAAMEILRKGGNAVDAAIAAAAAQGVTRPFSGGMGGGGMMMIYLADEKRFVTYDHRELSPSTFGPHSFLDGNGNEYSSTIRGSSGPAFAVPGAVKAWEKALKEHGTMTLKEVLEPAIRIAEEGFIIDDNFVREVTENRNRFNNFESTRKIYLTETGGVPAAGSTLKNPDMARTYRLLGEHGSEVFYEGEIADAIVETINNPPVVANPSFPILKGNLPKEDMKDYEVIEYDPVKVNYRGYDVYGMPPSSSGGTTIGQALNILEAYDMAGLPREEALHYYIEASRYAFADRDKYLQDPAHAEIPFKGMVTKGYAEERRYEIGTKASVGKVAPGNPWPYDANPDLWPTPKPKPQTGGFVHSFSGQGEWDQNKFLVEKSSDASFDIVDGKGRITLADRRNSYGRVTPHMEAIADAELLIPFKMDQLGADRRLRLWLRTDGWNNITTPHNGYGVEIRTTDNKVRILRYINGTLTEIGVIDRQRSTDWQWLRYSVKGDELSIKLWKDGETEQEDWDLQLTDGNITGKGHFMMSALEFKDGGGGGGSFQIGDIEVKELKGSTPNPIPGPGGENFTYQFEGVNGTAWDPSKFIVGNNNAGVKMDVYEGQGRIVLPGVRLAYGRAEAQMDPALNSELLIPFKINDLGADRRLRFWLRSDQWGTTTTPANGYGIEIRTGSNQIRTMQTKTGQDAITYPKDITRERTTEWQWLRFKVIDDQILAKFWKHSEEEPASWDIQITDQNVITPGRFMISSLEWQNDAGGSFSLGNLVVTNLDQQPDLEGDINALNFLIQPEVPEVVEPVELEVPQEVVEAPVQEEVPQEPVTVESDEMMPVEKKDADTETIHLSVSDKNGNIVAYTNTIVSIGGNGMVVPGYGFLLNDALAGRVPSVSGPGEPNAPKPKMRNLSSMSPTIILKDGKPVMTAGAPGSATIITTILQVIVNHLDFGMTLPDAVASPRLSQRNLRSGNTTVEPAFVGTPDYQALRQRGQGFETSGLAQGIGSVTAIAFLPDGQVQAVAEPVRRGGGSAMVESQFDASIGVSGAISVSKGRSLSDLSGFKVQLLIDGEAVGEGFTNQAGQYSILTERTGAASIIVTAPGYKKSEISIQLTGSVRDVDHLLKYGDFNADGDIDLLDIELVSKAYGQQATGEYVLYDLNQDGYIRLNDILPVLLNVESN